MDGCPGCLGDGCGREEEGGKRKRGMRGEKEEDEGGLIRLGMEEESDGERIRHGSLQEASPERGIGGAAKKRSRTPSKI